MLTTGLVEVGDKGKTSHSVLGSNCFHSHIGSKWICVLIFVGLVRAYFFFQSNPIPLMLNIPIVWSQSYVVLSVKTPWFLGELSLL